MELEANSADPARRKRRAAQLDPTGNLMLAAPVFLFYQLGLLFSPRAANGVDLFTRTLGSLVGLSRTVYLVVVLVLVAVYALVLFSLAKRHRFHPRRFPVVLMESGLYAVLMGPVAGLLLSKLHVLGGWIDQMGTVDRIVASAGAGFYEELVFRLAGLSTLLWWLCNRGFTRWLAVLLATVVSAVVFSAVHYVGPGSDPFSLASFAYRLVLGVFLGTIFYYRGFATAVFAHFFYDVYVMVILMD